MNRSDDYEQGYTAGVRWAAERMRECADTWEKAERVNDRVFGPKFEKPCVDPHVTMCARYECQALNKCRLDSRETVGARG